MTDLPENLISHPSSVTRQLREEHKAQRSFILWFTGLPCAGKSTLANAVESALHQQKLHTYLLDGDNVRHGLNRDLGFSMQERTENLRRIGEVGKLCLDAGIVTLAAFISPLRKTVRCCGRCSLQENFWKYIAVPRSKSVKGVT